MRLLGGLSETFCVRSVVRIGQVLVWTVWVGTSTGKIKLRADVEQRAMLCCFIWYWKDRTQLEAETFWWEDECTGGTLIIVLSSLSKATGKRSRGTLSSGFFPTFLVIQQGFSFLLQASLLPDFLQMKSECFWRGGALTLLHREGGAKRFYPFPKICDLFSKCGQSSLNFLHSEAWTNDQIPGAEFCPWWKLASQNFPLSSKAVDTESNSWPLLGFLFR